jgi:hypothetical protein
MVAWYAIPDEMSVLVGATLVHSWKGVKDGMGVQVAIRVEVSLGRMDVVGVSAAGKGSGVMVSVGKVIKVGSGMGGKGFKLLYGLMKMVAKKANSPMIRTTIKMDRMFHIKPDLLCFGSF